MMIPFNERIYFSVFSEYIRHLTSGIGMCMPVALDERACVSLNANR